VTTPDGESRFYAQSRVERLLDFADRQNSFAKRFVKKWCKEFNLFFKSHVLFLTTANALVAALAGAFGLDKTPTWFAAPTL
jgi:hypothetical protein